MQDMQAYLEKLHRDAVDCALISRRATDAQKKELFDRLADHLAMLASELEHAIEAKGAAMRSARSAFSLGGWAWGIDNIIPMRDAEPPIGLIVEQISN